MLEILSFRVTQRYIFLNFLLGAIMVWWYSDMDAHALMTLGHRFAQWIKSVSSKQLLAKFVVILRMSCAYSDNDIYIPHTPQEPHPLAVVQTVTPLSVLNMQGWVLLHLVLSVVQTELKCSILRPYHRVHDVHEYVCHLHECMPVWRWYWCLN